MAADEPERVLEVYPRSHGSGLTTHQFQALDDTGPGPGAGMPAACDGARMAPLRMGPGRRRPRCRGRRSWLGAVVLAALAKGDGREWRLCSWHPRSTHCPCPALQRQQKSFDFSHASHTVGKRHVDLHADVMKSIHRRNTARLCSGHARIRQSPKSCLEGLEGFSPGPIW